jgi:hypothetical protein
MKMLRTRIGLASATIAIFALPGAAMAESEYYVPPSNSAATQYTEAFPTAGGQKQVDKGGHKDGGRPAAVLGARNAHRLDAHGPEGQAAAEVAAATAPTTGVTVNESAAGGDRPARDRGNAPSGGTAESTKGRGLQGDASQPDNQEGSGSSETAGSSGLGSVISQATGTSSSGNLGVLLPLFILAALAWSVAFVLRQRKRPTE